MVTVDRDTRLKEIRENFSYLEGLSIDSEHHGKYAVLRAQKIVNMYASIVEAELAARKAFADGIYSIQQIAQQPVNLGYYSYADSQG